MVTEKISGMKADGIFCSQGTCVRNCKEADVASVWNSWAKPAKTRVEGGRAGGKENSLSYQKNIVPRDHSVCPTWSTDSESTLFFQKIQPQNVKPSSGALNTFQIRKHCPSNIL